MFIEARELEPGDTYVDNGDVVASIKKIGDDGDGVVYEVSWENHEFKTPVYGDKIQHIERRG